MYFFQIFLKFESLKFIILRLMIIIFILVHSRDMITFIHINLGLALIALCSTFLCIDVARPGFAIKLPFLLDGLDNLIKI